MLIEVVTAPSSDGRCTVVQVRGQVDLSSVQDLRDALNGAAASRRAVVVDLTRVTFFSAAGLRCLEQFDDVVSSLSGQFGLVFAGDSHPVSVVLRAVETVDRWSIHPSAAAALAEFAKVRSGSSATPSAPITRAARGSSTAVSG
jgi:anti-anti-sigma factor